MILPIQKQIRLEANPAKAKHLQRFFKTAEGQYGHGDHFLGLTVPEQRVIVQKNLHLNMKDVEQLLDSKFHEERLIGVLILVAQFKKADEKVRAKIYAFYLKKAHRINNWDLVDASAHHIVGEYLYGKDKKDAYRLVNSKLLWERRIAMVACWHEIRKGQCDHTFEMARALLKDEEDLMHKAVGWMLREVGKHVSRPKLEAFLKEYYPRIPRTALRYAIEHFTPERRQAILKGRI